MAESPSILRIQLIFGFLLVFGTISVIGYLAYETLDDLVTSIEEEAKPSKRLALLREILTDLSDAESSVRSYTITGDAGYIKPYYASGAEIGRKLTELSASMEEGNAERMDSLNKLVTAKFESLQALIEVKNDANTLSILQQVLNDLESLDSARLDSLYAASIDSLPAFLDFETDSLALSEPTDTAAVSKKKKGWGIFRKLFGGGRKKQQEATDSLSLAGAATDSGTVIIEEEAAAFDLAGYIAAKLARLEQEQQYQNESRQAQELTLTRRDHHIMMQINAILHKMEADELLLSQRRAAEAASTREKTTYTALSIVGVVILIILVLLYRIFSDITKAHRNRQALRAAMEEAEYLAKVKEEFLSNMSHEIRTPLHAIIGFADQLHQTTLAAPQQAQLEMIRKSSDHLQMLINDILDYSKLNSGKLSLESIGFSPAHQLDEVCDMLQSRAAEKGIALIKDGRGLDEVILLGDPLRLQQLMINLIGNAIKFTHEGAVTVRMEGSQHTEGDEEFFAMILTISDTGIGIAPGKQQEIFENFNQADNSTTRRYGGTGLGLTIVRRLVELHQGNLRLESSPGKGTTFTIRLQYATGGPQDLPELPRDMQLRPDNRFAGLRFLVADDEPYNLALIEQMLQKWGAEVITATNGRQAWELFRQQRFDAVLTDIQMPELNGIALTKKIREEAPFGESPDPLPILALSARSMREDAQVCLEAGMSGYLIKPFRERDLILLLEQHVTARGEGKATSATAVAAPEEEIGEEPIAFDLEGLLRVAGGNEEFVRNMLTLFIKNAERDLVLMQTAFGQRDLETVARTAHKMTGPARHLGMEPLVDVLKSLETGIDTQEIDNQAIVNLLTQARQYCQRYFTQINLLLAESGPNAALQTNS